MNLITRHIIDEREVVLLSEKGFVGESSEMILENVKNQLINDPQLNLVMVNKPSVFIFFS